MIDRPNVVFDCDGVLVDSESLSWGAWTSVLGSHGYLPNQEDQQESFGRRTQDLYRWFARRVELPPIDVFSAELQQEVLRRFDDSLTPFEDAIDLLRRLEATDIVIAVASSSSRERLDHALNITGLAGKFTSVICGDDVYEGKPAPDIYLHAARQIGAEPSRCTAIEDSPAGIVSAAAAGMSTIGIVRGHVDPALLSNADHVTRDLRDVTISTDTAM